MEYFELRRVKTKDYDSFTLPEYLKPIIASIENPRILDFGCGFGQFLRALKSEGFSYIEGFDTSMEAIQFCRSQGFKCIDGTLTKDFYIRKSECYDFVIVSHVLEHFSKDEIIQQLLKIKDILKPNGAVIVMVPNAQSNTGAYWAYEDFTHQYLFTSGSLYFVLKSAGFCGIEFLDVDCTAGLSLFKRFVIKCLLRAYKTKYDFWNRVTNSSFHRSSPVIFSYEIKALAKK